MAPSPFPPQLRVILFYCRSTVLPTWSTHRGEGLAVDVVSVGVACLAGRGQGRGGREGGLHLRGGWREGGRVGNEGLAVGVAVVAVSAVKGVGVGHGRQRRAGRAVGVGMGGGEGEERHGGGTGGWAGLGVG